MYTKKAAPFASENAINIHFLERFVGDYGQTQKGAQVNESRAKPTGKRVAVVGSGPAGICCAGELSRAGVEVTVFEALHDLGGVLRYGIPPFRLPRDILDFEIHDLEKKNVRFVVNTIIGKTKMLEELFAQGYDAIFFRLGRRYTVVSGAVRGEFV